MVGTFGNARRGTMPRKLTPKEEAFCQAIADGLNQSKAYRKAYGGSGMKAKTVNEKASRLMAKGKIRARVAELRAPMQAKTDMKRDELARRLTKMIRSDIRKMFDENGRMKPVTELDEAEASIIERVEIYDRFEGQGGDRKLVRRTWRYYFIDKLSLMVQYGKLMGFYPGQPGYQAAEKPVSQPASDAKIVCASISPREAYRRMTGGF
jgi:phage terminase small subunit